MASDIVKGLRTLLLTEGTITALTSTRIYPTKAPQNAPIDLEHIVLERTDTDPLLLLGDPTAGMRFTNIDIDCKGPTYQRANDVAKVVEAFLKDYTGAMGADDNCDAVLFEDLVDDYEKPRDATDQGRFKTTVVVQIQHTPT